MKQIINGKLYDTETAELITSDRYWDGRNFERNGTNTYLYKTKKGAFFKCYRTLWQGDSDYIEPLDKDEAKELYEELPEYEIDYEEAFGEKPIEA